MSSFILTEYRLPNGKKVQHDLSNYYSNEIEQKALFIISKGYKFEGEILITGDISFTITDIDPEKPDIDIELILSPNIEKRDKGMINLIERVYNKIK